MTKKDFPLAILKALEKFVHLKGEKFTISPSKEFLVEIMDSDDESNFHLIIEKHEFKKEGLYILLNTKPTDENNIALTRKWIKIESLATEFENWMAILDEYRNTHSFFDDPIIKSFSDGYYAEFEIIDENSEIEPLNPKQILFLDKHLENIEQNITKHETESNKKELDEIKEDVIYLRENLTSKSKVWVIKKLSTIWAKLTKQGTTFLKEFLSEAKKQVIKESVKFLIEQAPELLN